MIRLFDLVRAQGGAAVIELALIAPVLGLMVVGVVDLSLAFGQKLAIEQAVQRAIEKVAQTTGEETAEDTIKKEAVCQINGTNVDNTCKAGRLTTADVAVTYSLTCNGVAKAYGLDCADGETEVRYISARVTDKYTPLFPVHLSAINVDNTYHLSATAGVRVK